MAITLQNLKDLPATLYRLVWETDTAGRSWWKRGLVRGGRIMNATIRDLASGDLSLRAMSLVYTTIISLVPLLALSFSVLKGFGVHNQIRQPLLNVLAPLGEKGIEIADKIIEFVDNIKIGVLGVIGLGLLIYTVISMMQKIENSFNHIWRVSRGRTLGQKFTDYLSVILVGPFLIFISVGLTTSIRSHAAVSYLASMPYLGDILEFFGLLLPYIIMAFAFAFIYIYMPNTKVKFRSAFIGGLVTAVAWKTMGWVFAEFVANSSSRAAIYSAFASILIFMLWLYLGWLVLLVGSTISYYHQHPQHSLIDPGKLRLSNRAREKLGLTLLYHIARAFDAGEKPWTTDRFTDSLQLPVKFIDEQLDVLIAANLVICTDHNPPQLLPARPLEKIPLDEVHDLLRRSTNRKTLSAEKIASVTPVDTVTERVQAAIDSALTGSTLKDLVEAQELREEPVAGPAVATRQ